jgi:DNA primase
MAQTKSSWVDFKLIKSKVSIVQILERYGALESLAKSANGDRLSGACPIHGGTNKTHFRVSVLKNCWNCFGPCQGGGNIIDFVAKKEDVPFRDAALLIQEWFMDETAEEPAPPARNRIASAEQTTVQEEPFRRGGDLLSEEHSASAEESGENPVLSFELAKLDQSHPYLKERGLSAETIATFGLGYCAKGVLRGHVAIPIHNRDGGIVGYAGRFPGTPPKGQGKYKLPKGFKKSLEVFNLHRAALSEQDAPLVVVEGFFDCFALHQAGYERVVALMGSSLSDDQEQAIIETVSKESVIVFFDNNEAGRKGAAEAVWRLAQQTFVRVVLAEGEGRQPEDLSPDELRLLLPFPEGGELE